MGGWVGGWVGGWGMCVWGADSHALLVGSLRGSTGPALLGGMECLHACICVSVWGRGWGVGLRQGGCLRWGRGAASGAAGPSSAPPLTLLLGEQVAPIQEGGARVVHQQQNAHVCGCGGRWRA